MLTAKGTVIICPGCPRKSLTSIVASKSWNLQPTHDSGAKLCAKLRVYISKLPRCPKYSEKEKLDYYLQGFYIPTKTRLDELIEYECIQKKHFSLQALTKLQKITVEESDTSFQRFSLKKMAPVSFSLRSLMHK